MKGKRLPAVLVVLLTLGLLFANSVPALAVSASVKVLVTFDHEPQPSDIALITALGGSAKRTFRFVPVVAARIPSANVALLRASAGVVAVEDDVSVRASEEVLPWGVDRIDAELVHPFNKGAGVKVAVLDSGIDLDHPDMAVSGNVTFVAGTTSGDDDFGHGTKVAGVIAALSNGIGVVGVAPEAQLYSVKVLNSSGVGNVSDILAGIEWAIENRMEVINMSFSSYLQFPSAVADAIGLAYDTGILLVAGTGNNGTVEYPAAYPEVIAVGATDSADNQAGFSGSGSALELMAPGVDINTTAIGSYGTLTGTSVSSPHVAGVGALLVASLLDDNRAVRQRMQTTARDLGASGWDSLYGYGLVDAGVAVQQTPVRSEYLPPTTTVSLNGTAGNNGWYRSNVTVILSAQDETGGSGVAEIKYSLNGGDTWLTYTGPFAITTEGTNLVVAKSWDVAGNAAFLPEYRQILIDKTAPAVSISPSPSAFQWQTQGTMLGTLVMGSASDGLSGVASKVFDVQDEYNTVEPVVNNFGDVAYIEAWCPPSDRSGRIYSFSVVVTDFAGNQATAVATVWVLPKGGG